MSDRPNALLGDWYQPPADQTNPLLRQAPSWADAYRYNSQAYSDWVARKRAEGVQLGTIDSQTGWPTKAGYLDAVQQYGNALLLGTTAPGMRAYHGSPHSFERFDSTKIGTGEGAQAYGHGLYFAEREGVAKGYRDRLSDKTVSPAWLEAQGQHTQQMSAIRALDDKMMEESLARGGARDPDWGDIAIHPEVQQKYAPHLKAMNAERDRLYQNMMNTKQFVDNPGSMYEVNIKADPEHFLQWDKPLSEQHPKVQEALAKVYNQPAQRQLMYGEVKPYIDEIDSVLQGTQLQSFSRMIADDIGLARGQWELPKIREYLSADPAKLAQFDAIVQRLNSPTGKEIYHGLAGTYPGQIGGMSGEATQAAAQALREAGIPGIRYLDQGSRTAGEGSHNLVVFDDATIEILRKYGLAGLMLGGGAAAGAQGQ